MSKLIDAAQVVQGIPDGAVVAIPGNASILVVDHLLAAIEERFLREGHPRNLTAYLPCTASLGPGTGLDRLAHKGLLKRIIAGSYPIYQGSPIVEMVAQGVVEAYNFPMGVLYALLREAAAGRPGLLTEVGLGTYVDPRNGGGRLNEATRENLVEVVNFQGREYLFFRCIPIDVALLKATTADTNGNVTMEQEPQTLGARSLAMAARANGGKVIVQVKQVVARHSLSPRDIVLPENLVDSVVIAADAPQSAASRHDPGVTGELRLDLARTILPLGPERTILMRAAQEVRAGWFINIGVGMGIDLTRLLREAHAEDEVTVSTEHGAINGLPLHPPAFGAHVNPDAIIDPTDMFDMYTGGALNATFLGMAQTDEAGNINVSRFGGRLMGCGGFMDITSRTKNLFFCGLFSAGGTRYAIRDGKLVIEKEGSIRKFVKNVEQITLNGQAALRKGQSVTLITERGLFRLTPQGWVLQEAAPGVDPDRDIAPMMDFKLKIASDLRRFDARLMSEPNPEAAAWLRREICGAALE
jgi:propionate CoA-transferase